MSHTSRRRRMARRSLVATQSANRDLQAALSRLGLPSDATAEEVQEAVARLRSSEAVASVPLPLRDPPSLDAAGVERPERRRGEELGPDEAETTGEGSAEPERVLVGTGAEPDQRPGPLKDQSGDEPEGDPFEGVLDDDSDGPVFQRHPGRSRPGRPRSARSSESRSGRLAALLRSPVVLLAVAVLTAVAVVTIQQSQSSQQGLPAGHPAVGASGAPAGGVPTAAASTPQLDQAKVAELTAKVQANPRDAESMNALGDLYSRARQPQEAKQWHSRAVEVAPGHVDARLALGVDLYNLDDVAEAITQWTEVTRIDPRQTEAWYNLGFAYLGQNPPDMPAVERCWNRVVELDPGSDMAQTVRGHLSRLGLGPSAPASPSASRS